MKRCTIPGCIYHVKDGKGPICRHHFNIYRHQALEHQFQQWKHLHALLQHQKGAV